jgi:hypothetical protein
MSATLLSEEDLRSSSYLRPESQRIVARILLSTKSNNEVPSFILLFCQLRD